MQAEAEPEVGDAVGAGEASGLHLALDAALTKAAGHDDAVDLREELAGARAVDVLGVEPVDVDGGVEVDRGMDERFLDGEIGVGQLHVLPDDGDVYGALRVL